MALDLVLFDRTPVSVLKIQGKEKFLARLLTGDVSKQAVGTVMRTVMMNATGGIIGLPWVARTANDAYELIIWGEEADAQQAWVRQVSVAFDAEVVGESLTGVPFVGKLPLEGIALPENSFVTQAGVRLMNMGWINMVAGTDAAMTALSERLIAAGAKKGEKSGLDALRIFAREPAMGLEITEGVSPLEAGLENALDFEDADRIFIGRALTEARFKAGNYCRLQLIAFDVPFDPNLLVDVPAVVAGGLEYPLTSIARIPEGPYTVGLVQLPADVKIGSKVKTKVLTDPAVACGEALVIDRQL